MVIKKTGLALMLAGTVAASQASVCKIAPGSVTCGQGTVNSLVGNGMVSVNGTTITGPTSINGLLTADDASFTSLQVNGSTSLVQCTINLDADIKGSLKASSTKFENTLHIYSNSSRLINSKVNQNLHVHHTDSLKQEVYLDNNSEVGGDIIFDDGQGKVVLRGGSKIKGTVKGGEVVNP
ncbi:MAG: hypothetical protein H2069_04540 [Legionella sp.]|nr:hypothetical protein [Legionella sp.]